MEYQSYIYGKNHWLLEPDLKHLLRLNWLDFQNKENELVRFGELAGGRAYEVADTIDRSASPELVAFDLDGHRVDRVRLDPAHRLLLQELAFINRPPYEGGSWHEHFALGYLLADPGLYCSLIVTNQTVYAIHKYLPEQKSWIEPLLSGNAWGATWMTEVQGGSDLGANQTVARNEQAGWRLYSENKYFASNAGLADIAITTARPEGATHGPKGIALFLVPRLDERGQLNFLVRRLKRKSATQAVPTGEIEFHGSQAYLIGEAGLGIYYTMENLTVSRLANAAGALGLARKAHLEALARVQCRSSFGSLLIEHPLIRRDLTDMAVRIAGGLALLFHAIQSFDRSWQEIPPYTQAYQYARLLSHLVKNRSAEHSTYITQLAMELFGGIGFLDDYAISRLHRESLVTPIWEGGSNIQALDLLEAIQKKGAHHQLLEEMDGMLEQAGTPAASIARQMALKSLARLTGLKPVEAQWYAKDLLTILADTAQVALLYNLASIVGERYAKFAELYVEHFLKREEYPAWAMSDSQIWLQ